MTAIVSGADANLSEGIPMLTRLSIEAVAVLRSALSYSTHDLAQPADLLTALRRSDSHTGRILRRRLPAQEVDSTKREIPASASIALADVLRSAARIARNDAPISTRDLLEALASRSGSAEDLRACVAALDEQGFAAGELPYRRASRITVTATNGTTRRVMPEPSDLDV